MPVIAQVGRRRPKVVILLIAIGVVLILGVCLHLYPFSFMISSSLKTPLEYNENVLDLTPEEPTVASYQLLFSTLSGISAQRGVELFRYPMSMYLKNSLLITAMIICLQIPITVLIAFSVSKLLKPGSARAVFYICIATLMIPGQIRMIPSFLLLSHFPWPTDSIPSVPFTDMALPSVSLIGTYWGVVLPVAFQAFNFLLLKGFFDTIDKDYIEAARIDGCSEIGTLFHIMLPLSRPVMAVVFYNTFTMSWNSFLGPWLVLMSDQTKWPLSVILYRIQYFITQWNPDTESLDPTAQMLMAAGAGPTALFALAFVESLPVFIMFLYFREHIMKGIKIQGLK